MIDLQNNSLSRALSSLRATYGGGAANADRITRDLRAAQTTADLSEVYGWIRKEIQYSVPEFASGEPNTRLHALRRVSDAIYGARLDVPRPVFVAPR